MSRSHNNGGVTLMGYPCLMITGRDFALEVLKVDNACGSCSDLLLFPSLDPFFSLASFSLTAILNGNA